MIPLTVERCGCHTSPFFVDDVLQEFQELVELSPGHIIVLFKGDPVRAPSCWRHRLRHRLRRWLRRWLPSQEKRRSS